jgi:hypothetical protein
VIATIEMRCTREQRDDLQRGERRLAATAAQQTESEWSQLISMLELSQRWQELIGEFTAGPRSSELPRPPRAEKETPCTPS